MASRYVVTVELQEEAEANPGRYSSKVQYSQVFEQLDIAALAIYLNTSKDKFLFNPQTGEKTKL